MCPVEPRCVCERRDQPDGIPTCRATVAARSPAEPGKREHSPCRARLWLWRGSYYSVRAYLHRVGQVVVVWQHEHAFSLMEDYCAAVLDLAAVGSEDCYPVTGLELAH